MSPTKTSSPLPPDDAPTRVDVRGKEEHAPDVDELHTTPSAPVSVRELPTLADSSSAGRSVDGSLRGASLDRSVSRLGRSGASIATLHDTMALQDAQRTRAFLELSAAVGVVMLTPLPALGGDALAKWIFAASTVIMALVNLVLARQLRDPTAYRMQRVVPAAFTSVITANCGIYYFGAFSPAVCVIPLGLYFFGLSHSFRSTFFIYVASALAYLAMAGPVALGLVADRGLVRPSLSAAEALTVIGAVELTYLATYLVARMSRRATEDALAAHDRAVRAIAGRDALLHEARMDLEGVLRARGLGRFTDELVGHYRLGEILGRGGMGEVYEAVHVDTEEPAAIKLLHPHVLDDDMAVKRFLRECKLVASLEVPNVVRVLETSEPGAPVPFIAMERLHGQDLADHLRAHGRLRIREVIELIRAVGRGLDAAKEAGIVHRDIKPRNLFRAETGAEEATWKILDFGVSKLAGEATMTHQNVVGTPSYMAPEQATGKAVSHRSDLFSLGVIAYRALTGRPAFSGDSAPAILYQVVNAMPPRPSEIAGRLTGDIDAVLAIALAKSPDDRFDSAAELADAFDRAARGRLPGELRERAGNLLALHPWA